MDPGDPDDGDFTPSNKSQSPKKRLSLKKSKQKVLAKGSSRFTATTVDVIAPPVVVRKSPDRTSRNLQTSSLPQQQFKNAVGNMLRRPTEDEFSEELLFEDDVPNKPYQRDFDAVPNTPPSPTEDNDEESPARKKPTFNTVCLSDSSDSDSNSGLESPDLSAGRRSRRSNKKIITSQDDDEDRVNTGMKDDMIPQTPPSPEDGPVVDSLNPRGEVHAELIDLTMSQGTPDRHVMQVKSKLPESNMSASIMEESEADMFEHGLGTSRAAKAIHRKSIIDDDGEEEENKNEEDADYDDDDDDIFAKVELSAIEKRTSQNRREQILVAELDQLLAKREKIASELARVDTSIRKKKTELSKWRSANQSQSNKSASQGTVPPWITALSDQELALLAKGQGISCPVTKSTRSVVEKAFAGMMLGNVENSSNNTAVRDESKKEYQSMSADDSRDNSNTSHNDRLASPESPVRTNWENDMETQSLFSPPPQEHQRIVRSAPELYETEPPKKAERKRPASDAGLCNDHNDVDFSRRRTGSDNQNSLSNKHAQFRGQRFPHSSAVQQSFQKVFGLKSFRMHQEEIVNAAMLGEDCFVLMPTGGGKSLCYQLPAISSPGITIVVSPLLSLIQDQVEGLVRRRVGAVALTSSVSQGEQQKIYTSLAKDNSKIKLLYVTPERIANKGRLHGVLQNLYARNRLSRFVIDEAHCVSQWGHDFRPDYKLIGSVRKDFSKVPMMALTATATERVREDVLTQLNMKGAKVFQSSFNRANLRYSVEVKSGNKTLDIMAGRIQTKYLNQSGIVYCLSRDECEKVATKLEKLGCKATAYHAGFAPEERMYVQQQWSSGQVDVICATIAFGMGIDKPDVRFVFHYSLPKSMEGYFQESGRAGRDGEDADCVLFYNYADKGRLSKIIDMSDGPWQQKQQHKETLNRMVAYCENVQDCRRMQQLGYFGERFDPKQCLGSCDVCRKGVKFVAQDVTEDARNLLGVVNQLPGGQHTLIQAVDIYRGANSKKMKNGGFDSMSGFGSGKKYTKNDAERLARHLVSEGYIAEVHERSLHGAIHTYIRPGKQTLRPTATKSVYLSMADKARPVSDKQKRRESAKTAESESVNKIAILIIKRHITRLANRGEGTKTMFAQQTIKRLAAALPKTVNEFVEIEGVGENLRSYGDGFVAACNHARKGGSPSDLPDDAALSSTQMQEAHHDGFGTTLNSSKYRYRAGASSKQPVKSHHFVSSSKDTTKSTNANTSRSTLLDRNSEMTSKWVKPINTSKGQSAGIQTASKVSIAAVSSSSGVKYKKARKNNDLFR